MNRSLSTSPIFVAGIAVQAIEVRTEQDSEIQHCAIHAHNKFGKSYQIEGTGSNLSNTIAATLHKVTRFPFVIVSMDHQVAADGKHSHVVIIRVENGEVPRMGLGRSDAESEVHGVLIACLKALNHAGCLRSEFAANNQKHLKSLAEDQAVELIRVMSSSNLECNKQLVLESMLLEFSNRIASSAVISATNATDEDSLLFMFDTSAWLYDSHGRRRSEFTDTDLWLAWYPGLECSESLVEEILESLPKVESKKLPWIVRAFENPESWLRFRGAMSLENHDILHVLLGRGLQDQDEAFVLGFAMGTARRYSYVEHHVFRWLLSKVYPEPYRIPEFVLPAFDLGLECGRQTGRRNLYRESLRHLKNLPVGQARDSCDIDVGILRKFYHEERKRIPFTVASIRLP